MMDPVTLSNAVLVAILPHVSDFAKKIELPVPLPLSINQVERFAPSPVKGEVAGIVWLKTGHKFLFNLGRVGLYDGTNSYYSLQDPSRVPQFFGAYKMDEKEAITLAQNVLAKLGYLDDEIRNTEPKIEKPIRLGDNIIPRYFLTWKGRDFEIEFEIDGMRKTVEQINLFGTRFRHDPPKLALAFDEQPVAAELAAGTNAEVSSAFSNAVLVAVIPHIAEYARKLELPIKPPRTEDVRYFYCRPVTNDPGGWIVLKSGYQFWFAHGIVPSFEDPKDYMTVQDTQEIPKYFGKLNLNEKEAISLARQAARRLGYPIQELAIDQIPEITGPDRLGTNVAPYYRLEWKHPDLGRTFVVDINAEEKKIVKAIVFTSKVWKDPPKIDLSPNPNAKREYKSP